MKELATCVCYPGLLVHINGNIFKVNSNSLNPAKASLPRSNRPSSFTYGVVSLWSYWISRVNTHSWGVLFVLWKHQESSIILLFGLRVSKTFLPLFIPLSSTLLSRVILPLTDPVQRQQLCFEKALFMSGRDHVAIHLFSTHRPETPLFPCLSKPLPLLFSPSGLCCQRGEMAAWQLWSYSGYLCRCGSHTGIHCSPLTDIFQTILISILKCHVYSIFYTF